MKSVEVREGGVEPCIQPPKELWSTLTEKETMTTSLLTRGYAIVKLPNHQVPIIEALQNAQKAFFSMSTEEKLKYKGGCHEVSSYGYSAVVNLKEYYQVRAGGKGSKLPYPSDGEIDFGLEALRSYYLFDELGRSCLDKLTKELKLDKKRMDLLLDPPPPQTHQVVREGNYVWADFLPDYYVSSSNVDVFIYPNLDKYNDNWSSNHPAHVDSGILSLIPCSDLPGLEFQDQKLNAWIAVEELIQNNVKEPESYRQYVVIMVGECLNLESNKRIGAGMHRVRRIPESKGPRYSIVYKMRARPVITGPRYQQDYAIIDIQSKALNNK